MTHIGERADARANRDRVVRAARAVFAERGTGAEIREIAERAGVGMGTVYRNFANRDELMAAIVGECIDEANGIVDRADSAPTPLEGIHLLLSLGWELAEMHGDLIDMIKEQAGAHGHSGRMQARIADLLTRAAEAGVVRADVPIPFLTTLLMGLFATYREMRAELGRDTAQRVATDAFFRVALVEPMPELQPSCPESP